MTKPVKNNKTVSYFQKPGYLLYIDLIPIALADNLEYAQILISRLKGKTLSRIAKAKGVSRERIFAIEQQALAIMDHFINNTYGKDDAS